MSSPASPPPEAEEGPLERRRRVRDELDEALKRLTPQRTALLLKGALWLGCGILLLQSVALGWIAADHPLAKAVLAGSILANLAGTWYFLRYLWQIWRRHR
ncbi:MAG: hypothetical protein D6757_10185 [Alphaproteobacteria bacterium]|nr:MAG: hypothetical protein D6757_10185 [Alphaproteobacteria bacterium]